MEDLYSFAHLEQVTRYLSWSPHPDLFYTKDYLEYVGEQYAVGAFFDWGLAVPCPGKRNGKIIGTCGFTRFNFAHDSGEIGYVLHPDYWGQGLATEALKRMIEFGFQDLQLHRLECRFMDENTASRRVAEKCGMKFEGWMRDALFVKGEYRTIGICSLLSEDIYPL